MLWHGLALAMTLRSEWYHEQGGETMGQVQIQVHQMYINSLSRAVHCAGDCEGCKDE